MKLLATLLLLAASALGQTNFSGGGSFNTKSGLADPNGSVNCTPTSSNQASKLYYRTATNIGWYACTGTNTWSFMGTSAGTGITSLNGQIGATQTFSNVNDTNVTLAIASATNNHAFTLGWTGTLAKPRQNAATVYTDQANTFGAFLQKFQAGNNFNLVDPVDTTKVLKWNLAAITTGTTRQIIMPDGDASPVKDADCTGTGHILKIIAGVVTCSADSGTGGMVYPGAGIAVSTGVGWGTSIGYSAGAITLPNGGSIGTGDTGNPTITFGPNSITANQPLSVPSITTTGPAAASTITCVAAPSTPGAGQGAYYCDTTSKALAIKNDAGVVSHTVQSKTAVANSFVTQIADDGTVSVAQPAFSNLSGAATAAQLPASVKIRSITFSFGSPEGSALSTGITRYVTVPFGCTISAYNLLADAGTFTVKFWKVATGTAIPTVANSISTSGVSLSTGTALHSTTVTDFTSTTVTANDIMAANITAVATAKFVQAQVECDQ